MNKATATAPANIAFIKYWGKRDASLNIPLHGSISMNFSTLWTATTVEFGKSGKDQVSIDGRVVRGEERERVIRHLDLIRKIAGTALGARVTTQNNFPSGVGIASSASGFAALTLAATRALGLRLSERELSILARHGSGSACRSIPDGFVEWRAGSVDGDSYARSLYSEKYWDICDIVVLVSCKAKNVGSIEGHRLAPTSPFFPARIRKMPARLRRFKQALGKKDFRVFGEIIEEEALNMHAVMMTSRPALLYWEPATVDIMRAIRNWRLEGLEAYFTLDAGPTVHVICRRKDASRLSGWLKKIRGVERVSVNHPSIGARLIEEHLFS